MISCHDAQNTQEIMSYSLPYCSILTSVLSRCYQIHIQIAGKEYTFSNEGVCTHKPKVVPLPGEGRLVLQYD
jgi:hypothetical protein